MKVSEQQIFMMYHILIGTTKIKNTLGGFSMKSRIQLANNIMNQQSKKIINFDENDTEDRND